MTSYEAQRAAGLICRGVLVDGRECRSVTIFGDLPHPRATRYCKRHRWQSTDTANAARLLIQRLGAKLTGANLREVIDVLDNEVRHALLQVEHKVTRIPTLEHGGLWFKQNAAVYSAIHEVRKALEA